MTGTPGVPAKTILHKVRHDPDRWFGIHYAINLYRGCCHGCVYCDSRSACYRIEDFDQARSKIRAVEILEAELSRLRKPDGLVAGMGSMSDPYNPREKDLELTRRALMALRRRGLGMALATKSDLVVRDLDILADSRAPALVKITVTAADDGLARRLEPCAPSSSARLKALRVLAEAGVFVGILFMPVLPFLTDSEGNVRRVVRLAAENGARFVYPLYGVTLRDRQRAYFQARLDECFPGLWRRYARTFGNTFMCFSPRAEKLRAVFETECDARGLLHHMADIVRVYGQARKKTREPAWPTLG